MKICFITDYLPGYHKLWGGAETACLRLARLLIKGNQGVEFLTTYPTEKAAEGFKIFPINIIEDMYHKRSSRIKSYFSWDSTAANSAYKILKDIKPDIVHLHRFPALSLSMISVVKKLDIPIIISVYDYWYLCPKAIPVNSQGMICNKFQGPDCLDCYPARGYFGIFAKKNILRIRRNIFKHFLNKIDTFIVLSNSNQEDLRKFGIKRNIVKLPLPLFDEPINTQEEPILENIILFVGWIYPHKGLHILIESMPEVLKEIPQIKLYVVETGVDEGYRNKINDLIRRYNLKDKVIFLGKKTSQEVQSLLQEASVVCVPEQWPNPYPIIITEAMSYSRPIVASRIGGIPELVRDGQNGLLVNPSDAFGFVRNIISILKDKELARRLGESAQKDILEICNEDNILKELLNIYKSIRKYE